MADLEYLRAFLATYRSGSVTKAAEYVHLSQPAVSGQIKALEQQLGRTLFTRTPRGIVSTLTDGAGGSLGSRSWAETIPEERSIKPVTAIQQKETASSFAVPLHQSFAAGIEGDLMLKWPT
jgi:Bacterial regulatory helix-turn-helix protein, lysR family